MAARARQIFLSGEPREVEKPVRDPEDIEKREIDQIDSFLPLTQKRDKLQTRLPAKLTSEGAPFLDRVYHPDPRQSLETRRKLVSVDNMSQHGGDFSLA